jgi:hypothetical protein
MPKHSSRILEYAKRGAEARLRELAQEARYLIDLFPHLRDSFDKDEMPIDFLIAKGSGRLKRRAARQEAGKGMSPAGRKAVSDRMKKYWAARRAAEKKG